MLTPITDATKQLYLPLNLLSTDRMSISLVYDKLSEEDEERGLTRGAFADKFRVNIHGSIIHNPDGTVKHRRIYSQKENKYIDGPPEQHWPSGNATRRFCQRIPERRQLTNDAFDGELWEFAATDITASLIQALWIKPAIDDGKESPVTFADDAREVFQDLLIRCLQLNRNAEIIAAFKSEKKILPVNDLQWCAEKPLIPHQQVSLHLCHNNDAFAEFMEPGTGKTAPLIAEIDNAALELHEKLNGSPNNGKNKLLTVLIACPKNIRRNWESEIEGFSTVDGKVTVLRGNEMDRLRAYIDSGVPGTQMQIKRKAQVDMNGYKYSIIICSFDMLSRMPALVNFPWDICILDESQGIKDPTTKRWEACDILRAKAKRRFIASGTPYGNSISDLWTQLEFLGKGWSGFLNPKNFKDFYTVYDDSSGTRRPVGYQNLPFIQERLMRCSLFVSLKEARPDLPEKVYRVVEAEMDAEQAMIYNKVAKELMYKIESELENNPMADAITVNNILTQLLRLAQITSGFVTWDAVYDDEGNCIKEKRCERLKQQNKIEQVIEILKAKGPKEKTIIWCCWCADPDKANLRDGNDILALTEAIEKYNKENPDNFLGNVCQFYGRTSEADRELAIWDFNNDDNCKIFIGNGASGGAGLNLLGYPPHHPELSECNATETIVYSQNWSSLIRQQLEARNHRTGTREQVTITDLQIYGTIDTEIRDRVWGKRQAAYEISDLKDILKKVLNHSVSAGE